MERIRSNPAEIFAKAPDKYVTIVHQREGDMVRTYDGHDAWVVLPLTVTGEYQLTASAAEGGKLDGELAFPGNIKIVFQYLASELSRPISMATTSTSFREAARSVLSQRFTSTSRPTC